MRKAAKRDANETLIVNALARNGIQTEKVSLAGWPDLLAWRVFPNRGPYEFLEVKSRRGRLTDAQKKFKGHFHVVRSPEEALAVFGITEP